MGIQNVHDSVASGGQHGESHFVGLAEYIRCLGVPLIVTEMVGKLLKQMDALRRSVRLRLTGSNSFS